MLIVQGPQSIQDHAMTVCSFLNEYKAAVDPTAQSALSHQFSCYILSVCRPRLSRRLLAWPALGLVYRMTKAIDDPAFEFAITHWQDHSPGQGNNTFAKYLAKPSIQQDMLPAMAMTLSQVLGREFTFTLLIEAVNDSVSGQKANQVFYNQHTFLDFHMLFLACLIGMVSTYMHLEKLLEKYGTVGQ